MDEYIKRETALSLVQPDTPQDEKAVVTIATAKKLIRIVLHRTPAADVAPVRHGKWTITEGMIENAVCSNCGRHFQSYYEEYRYCPNCGAEMMGETHESEKQLQVIQSVGRDYPAVLQP